MFNYRPKESYWCFSLPNQTPEELKKSSEFAVHLNNFCNKLFERRWLYLIQGRWRTAFSGCKWGEAGRANSSSVIFPALPSAQHSLFSSCHGTGRLYPGTSGSHRGKGPLEMWVDGHAPGHLAPLQTPWQLNTDDIFASISSQLLLERDWTPGYRRDVGVSESWILLQETLSQGTSLNHVE